MKKPFRFFRGEFNGFYLYRLVTCLNHYIQDILDELVYQTLFQWKTEDEVSKGEFSIRDDTIVGIGKIAGVFQSLGKFMSNIGSIYFSRSHIVNGVERSERGLVDMEREVFEYLRVAANDYSDDIVTEASPKKRISVVPKGTEPIGYVPMGTPLFEEDGTIIWENLLPDPPETGAFVPFFGEQYLVFEEQFLIETTLTVPIFKLLIECMQRVRFNGPSVALFLDIVQILGEGYIYDIDIIPKTVHTPSSSKKIGDAKIGRFKIGEVTPESDMPYYEVQYKLDNNNIIDNQLRRYAVFKIVCSQKFKLFDLVDVSPI
jgi:hypothetical protein